MKSNHVRWRLVEQFLCRADGGTASVRIIEECFPLVKVGGLKGARRVVAETATGCLIRDVAGLTAAESREEAFRILIEMQDRGYVIDGFGFPHQ